MRRTSGGRAARAWRHVRVGLAAEAADAARRIMCRRCRRCAQTRRPSLFSLFSLPSSFLSSFAAVPQDCNARLQCKTAMQDCRGLPLGRPTSPTLAKRSEARRRHAVGGRVRGQWRGRGAFVHRGSGSVHYSVRGGDVVSASACVDHVASRCMVGTRQPSSEICGACEVAAACAAYTVTC